MCIVARQRLGKHVPAATNTHTTIEELLDLSFHTLSALYQWKVDDFDPENRGTAFFAKTGEFLPNYMASHPRR
jgi:hypothetical protein